MGKTVLARALAALLGAELSRVQGHPDLLPSDITGVSVFMPDTGTGISGRVRCSPTSCWSTSSTARHPARSPPCSRRWRSARSAWTASPGRCPSPTWSSPRRTRARSSAPSRWSRASSTASPCRRVSATPTPRTRCVSRSMAEGPTPWPTSRRSARPRNGAGPTGHRDGAGAAAVATYAVELCRASRTAPGVHLGASPRAAIWLIRAAQAHAVLNARPYVVPDDVKAVAVACLAHRILTVEADAGTPSSRPRWSETFSKRSQRPDREPLGAPGPARGRWSSAC